MSGDWRLFQGTHEPSDEILRLPRTPSCADFGGVWSGPKRDDLRPLPPHSRDARRGRAYRPGPQPQRDHQIDMVNAALYLRRPLLITGQPGTGKSSLAYAVAYELKLGPVLNWPITSRSTLAQGLYRYDAIGRLRDTRRGKGKDEEEIGRYIHLGPLGTAFLESTVPRVLLIDEIDKSDIDLPNDLLNIFEEGEFEIPELVRLPSPKPIELSIYYARPDSHPAAIPIAGDEAPRETGTSQDPPEGGAGPSQADKKPSAQDVSASWGRAPVVGGRIRCREFPLVVMTSNEEREFPPPFLRRCLRLKLEQPDDKKLAEIVEAHFEGDLKGLSEERSNELRAIHTALITNFHKRSDRDDLATDQLLNVLYLLTRRPAPDELSRPALVDALLRSLLQSAGS